MKTNSLKKFIKRYRFIVSLACYYEEIFKGIRPKGVNINLEISLLKDVIFQRIQFFILYLHLPYVY